jgi:hypothetical protein
VNVVCPETIFDIDIENEEIVVTVCGRGKEREERERDGDSKDREGRTVQKTTWRMWFVLRRFFELV